MQPGGLGCDRIHLTNHKIRTPSGCAIQPIFPHNFRYLGRRFANLGGRVESHAVAGRFFGFWILITFAIAWSARRSRSAAAV